MHAASRLSAWCCSVSELEGFGLHLFWCCACIEAALIYGPWGQVSHVFCNVRLTSAHQKWNESGFRPPLCTYRLNWARRTSWGWWDDWDDTVLQTQDSKFEPWRSEAEHATSRSRRLPTILTFTRGWGRNNFVSFKPPRPGTEPRTLAWKAAVLTTTLGPPPRRTRNTANRSHMGAYIISWDGIIHYLVNYWENMMKTNGGNGARCTSITPEVVNISHWAITSLHM